MEWTLELVWGSRQRLNSAQPWARRVGWPGLRFHRRRPIRSRGSRRRSGDLREPEDCVSIWYPLVQVVLTFDYQAAQQSSFVTLAQAGTQKGGDVCFQRRLDSRPVSEYGVTFFRGNDGKCQHCLAVSLCHRPDSFLQKCLSHMHRHRHAHLQARHHSVNTY